MKETRIELGLYTKTKLRDDALKLHRERSTAGLAGYTVEFNLLALWELRSEKTTAQVVDNWMTTFIADSAAVSTSTHTVRPILASTVDLFAADTSGHQYAVVGLFEVTS